MEFKDMSRKLGLVLRAQAKAFADAERGKMLSPSMGCGWGGVDIRCGGVLCMSDLEEVCMASEWRSGMHELRKGHQC